MSQPLWYLRHDDRVIGPFPAPQIREFLKNEEISQDWEISLNEMDWLTIRDSGQFEDGQSLPVESAALDGKRWHEQREAARHRWLQDSQDIRQAQPHDLALERRARQALAVHEAETTSLLQAAQNRRPPVVAGLLAVLALLGAIYFIWRGQQGEPAIQAGIALKANCTQAPGEAVNWSGCDKRGFSAPGVAARNMRMENVILEGASLAGADMSYGNFSRANLRHANLSGMQLVGADLRGADLTGSDLSLADLSYAVLTGARIDGARLEGATLGKATWVDGHVCPEGAVGQCP